MDITISLSQKGNTTMTKSDIHYRAPGTMGHKIIDVPRLTRTAPVNIPSNEDTVQLLLYPF